MSELHPPSQVTDALAAFVPDQAALLELLANSKPMLHASDANAGQIHEARMPLKNARLEIERIRKQLTAPAVEFQRGVNDHARSLIAIVEPTEKALELRQRELEEVERVAKERKRQQALEEAEEWSQRFAAVGARKSVLECLNQTAEVLQHELELAIAEHQERERIAAEERAQREAAEAAARAQREAEEQERARKAAEERENVRREREALEAERKAEVVQRAAEARALAEARARDEAALRAQREALAAQQRALDEQRAAAEAAARAKAAAEAAAQAEADRRARALAAAPLAAQVRDLAQRIGAVQGPDDDRVCHTILLGAQTDLERYAQQLEDGEVTL